MKKILITGGSGLLGSNLKNDLMGKGYEVYAPTHQEMDITSRESLSCIIDKFKPEILIHCAAISKFDVAESRPMDTIEINIIGTCYITQECMKSGIKLVYISTSHVFDGNDGNYKFDDKINPLTKYSKSKAAGEMASLICENSLVIRTEFCGTEFPFETAFDDKYSSKEYIDLLIPRISEKCISNQLGICHVAGPRRSFYEFGKLRNPNVKRSSVYNLVKTSKIPILIDTSLVSN